MKKTYILLFLILGISLSSPVVAQQEGSGSFLKGEYLIDLVIRTARSYEETPYVWGGEDRNGVDCSGLTMRSFESVGVQFIHRAAAQYLHPGGVDIEKEDLRRGDLVFFWIKGVIDHVGLVVEVSATGRVRFIHASKSNGKVAYNYLEGFWEKKFAKGRRFFHVLNLAATPSMTPKSVKPLPESTPDFGPVVVSRGADKDETIPGRYPQASLRALTFADIQSLDPCEIRLMKNEIFARNGYVFHKNPAVRTYFHQQDWYKKVAKKSQDAGEIYRRYLSATEKFNASFLLRFEGECQ